MGKWALIKQLQRCWSPILDIPWTLKIIIFVGGTKANHKFVDESLADSLGYDS